LFTKRKRDVMLGWTLDYPTNTNFWFFSYAVKWTTISYLSCNIFVYCSEYTITAMSVTIYLFNCSEYTITAMSVTFNCSEYTITAKSVTFNCSEYTITAMSVTIYTFMGQHYFHLYGISYKTTYFQNILLKSFVIRFYWNFQH
jgi:hypothetical protein